MTDEQEPQSRNNGREGNGARACCVMLVGFLFAALWLSSILFTAIGTLLLSIWGVTQYVFSRWRSKEKEEELKCREKLIQNALVSKRVIGAAIYDSASDSAASYTIFDRLQVPTCLPQSKHVPSATSSRDKEGGEGVNHIGHTSDSLPTRIDELCMTKQEEVLNENAQCSICLDLFSVGNEVSWSKYLSCCNHVYHTDCIRQWLLAHEDCPMCRRKFLRQAFEGGNLDLRAMASFCIVHGLHVPVKGEECTDARCNMCPPNKVMITAPTTSFGSTDYTTDESDCADSDVELGLEFVSQ